MAQFNFNLISDFTFSPEQMELNNIPTEPNATTNNLQNIFEEVSNNPAKRNSLRDCRTWVIPENIETFQPGQYCVIPTAGGGWSTEWYYYKTLDGRHMLIFSTLNTSTYEKTFSGRELSRAPSNEDK